MQVRWAYNYLINPDQKVTAKLTIICLLQLGGLATRVNLREFHVLADMFTDVNLLPSGVATASAQKLPSFE